MPSRSIRYIPPSPLMKDDKKVVDQEVKEEEGSHALQQSSDLVYSEQSTVAIDPPEGDDGNNNNNNTNNEMEEEEEQSEFESLDRVHPLPIPRGTSESFSAEDFTYTEVSTVLEKVDHDADNEEFAGGGSSSSSDSEDAFIEVNHDDASVVSTLTLETALESKTSKKKKKKKSPKKKRKKKDRSFDKIVEEDEDDSKSETSEQTNKTGKSHLSTKSKKSTAVPKNAVTSNNTTTMEPSQTSKQLVQEIIEVTRPRPLLALANLDTISTQPTSSKTTDAVAGSQRGTPTMMSRREAMRVSEPDTASEMAPPIPKKSTHSVELFSPESPLAEVKPQVRVPEISPSPTIPSHIDMTADDVTVNSALTKNTTAKWLKTTQMLPTKPPLAVTKSGSSTTKANPILLQQQQQGDIVVRQVETSARPANSPQKSSHTAVKSASTPGLESTIEMNAANPGSDSPMKPIPLTINPVEPMSGSTPRQETVVQQQLQAPEKQDGTPFLEESAHIVSNLASTPVLKSTPESSVKPASKSRMKAVQASPAKPPTNGSSGSSLQPREEEAVVVRQMETATKPHSAPPPLQESSHTVSNLANPTVLKSTPETTSVKPASKHRMKAVQPNPAKPPPIGSSGSSLQSQEQAVVRQPEAQAKPLAYPSLQESSHTVSKKETPPIMKSTPETTNVKSASKSRMKAVQPSPANSDSLLQPQEQAVVRQLESQAKIDDSPALQESSHTVSTVLKSTPERSVKPANKSRINAAQASPAKPPTGSSGSTSQPPEEAVVRQRQPEAPAKQVAYPSLQESSHTVSKKETTPIMKSTHETSVKPASILRMKAAQPSPAKGTNGSLKSSFPERDSKSQRPSEGASEASKRPRNLATASSHPRKPSSPKSVKNPSATVSRMPVTSIHIDGGALVEGPGNNGDSRHMASVASSPGAYHVQGINTELASTRHADRDDMSVAQNSVATKRPKSKKVMQPPQSPTASTNKNIVIAAELSEDMEAKIEREVRQRILANTVHADLVSVESNDSGNQMGSVAGDNLKELHKPRNVKERLFGDARHLVDIAAYPESIRKRDYLQWMVKRNPATNQWVASVTTNQKAMEEGDQIELEMSKVSFAAKTQQEAYETGLSHATPLMQRFDDNPICHVCKSKFAMFRRPAHCRNCGVCICSNCTTTWPSKMLPDTYLRKSDKSTVNACLACDWIAHTFQNALLNGNFSLAIDLYQTGNVNLRSPYSLDKKAEAMYPIHMATVGGNLKLVRWLTAERFCPLEAIDPKKRVKNQVVYSPIVTSKGISALEIALLQQRIDIVHYLVSERGVSMFDQKNVSSDVVLMNLTSLLKVLPPNFFEGIQFPTTASRRSVTSGSRNSVNRTPSL